ncbi:MAG: hypothetical protein J0H11_13675 [Rhizobiales bacterium]|nr:hypothetical protein [Hyphomicrobiales bacterium]
MSRLADRQVRFRQIDVTRAVKGAIGAGMTVARIEIDPDGRIVIAASAEPSTPQSELDRWLGKSDAGTT